MYQNFTTAAAASSTAASTSLSSLFSPAGLQSPQIQPKQVDEGGAPGGASALSRRRTETDERHSPLAGVLHRAHRHTGGGVRLHSGLGAPHIPRGAPHAAYLAFALDARQHRVYLNKSNMQGDMQGDRDMQRSRHVNKTTKAGRGAYVLRRDVVGAGVV